MHEVIERWDLFLGKIRDRGQELFDTARQEGMNTFRASGNDPMPVSNALTGVRMQVHDLRRKIDDTWLEKVDSAMRSAGIGLRQLDAQRHKGETLQFELEYGFELLETELFYEMSLVILELAKQDEHRTLHCTQCQAPLEVPQHVYKATRVDCGFCRTVNTYEPGTYARMVGGFCADHIARWNTRDLKKKMMEAEHATHDVSDMLYQDENLEHTGNYRNYDLTYKDVRAVYRQACQQYWEAYYNELAKIKTDTNVEKEVRAKMEHCV